MHNDLVRAMHDDSFLRWCLECFRGRTHTVMVAMGKGAGNYVDMTAKPYNNDAGFSPNR